jgi:16S rRNA (uracil1498-N3)-methyltransferase
MSSHRFFLSAPFGSSISIGDEVVAPLSDADLHRASRTARLEEGERIVLVDPVRVVWECDVVSVTPHALTVIIAGTRTAHHEPDVTLFAGVTKGHKMDLTVEKSVELGASAIVPVMCERSIVRWDAEKAADRTTRWQRVASSAAAQAQRDFIPQVTLPVDVQEVVGLLDEYDVAIVAWEESAPGGLRDILRTTNAGDRIAVFVGPEGGLTAEEVGTLEGAGARCVGLGDHILRSETAGIVLTALTVYELGGLGGRSRG